MTSLFDTIADDTRRHLLENLRVAFDERRELSVGELVDELKVSQPTVSKHLRVLRDAELVSVRLDGQRRFYSLNAAALEPVVAWVEKVAGAKPERAAIPEDMRSADLSSSAHQLNQNALQRIKPRNNAANRTAARIGEGLAEVKVRGVEALDGVESGITFGVDAAREVTSAFVQVVAQRVVRPIVNAFSRER